MPATIEKNSRKQQRSKFWIQKTLILVLLRGLVFFVFSVDLILQYNNI